MIDMQGSRPISFDNLCPYWDLFEHNGLNEDVLAAKKYIKSPVLVLGSGQGFLSEALISRGYDVTSIDRSEEMISYARKRRNVDTIKADALSFSLDRTFNTAVISTGLITEMSITAEFIDGLMSNTDKHLQAGGHMIVAYFPYSEKVDAFKQLGLYGPSGNNSLFWIERNSLDNIKAMLIRKGYQRALVEHTFTKYRKDLIEQRDFIVQLGNRHVQIHKPGFPERFLDEECSNTYLYYLTQASQRLLIRAVAELHTIACHVRTQNNTNIIITRKQAGTEHRP